MTVTTDTVTTEGLPTHGVNLTDTAAQKVSGLLEQEGRTDLVKVDTEGSEEAIVAAIPADVRARVGEIVYEYPGGVRHIRP